MKRRVLVGPALAATLLLAACGGAAAAPNAAGSTTGGSTTNVSSAPTTVPASAASGATSNAGGSSASTPAAAAAPVKVSANKASRAELQRAFEAAGIPNAARWAMEVEEYRPYPTNDPSWAKLRRELAKYNISLTVLEQIINTLTVD